MQATTEAALSSDIPVIARHPLSMLRPDTFALTALLAFLTSFGPLSVDLYLPSMPAIAAALAAPPAHVQLTISLYLVGFAIGQVVHGPISDRIGRKPVIVLSFVLYCAATLICLVSTSIAVLIAGRFLQALGVSGSIVAVRAVVRDMYEGVRAGRQLSSMGVLMGFAPIIAPLTGGILQTAFGWRAGFVFLVAAGALAGYLAWRFLPETHHARTNPSLAGLLSNYRRVATHPVFLANLVVGAVAYGGLFAWIAGSPFVLQFVFGFSPLAYAIAYAASCLGFVAGSTLATRLVMRLGLDRTAGLGAASCTIAAVGMLLGATGLFSEGMLIAAAAFYLLGLGLMQSQLVAAALTPFPNDAGTASALIGFVQQCAGAIVGTTVGALVGTSIWPMAAGIAITGIGALILWVVTRRVRTGKSKPLSSAG
jgi:MFS transporter, DHA1 family, multidrug resistance protein